MTRNRWIFFFTLVILVFAESCGSSRVSRRSDRPTPKYVETGYASFYGNEFQGRRTANGERFDQKAFTAAHKSLPFGTWVDVVNVKNGKRVRVRVNDRGPFVSGRIVDLSYAAAKKLGIVKAGVGRVRVEVY